MPPDLAGDEVGAPALPRLCNDHRPVLGNLAHLDDVDHHATDNVRTELARQCPACRRLT